MSKKSFYSKYSKPEENEQPEQDLKCPAHECKFQASMFFDGGPWACRYHSNKPKQAWPKITEILAKNERLLQLVQVAETLRPEEYDKLIEADSFELEDLVKPVEGELHAQWVFRVKDTVNKALKHLINEAVDGCEVSYRDTESGGSKWAVSMLTSGSLLKKKARA